MLRSMNDLSDLADDAADGTIGHVKNFYFDQGACVLNGFRSGD